MLDADTRSDEKQNYIEATVTVSFEFNFPLTHFIISPITVLRGPTLKLQSGAFNEAETLPSNLFGVGVRFGADPKCSGVSNIELFDKAYTDL
jgi:hypothetical protein